MSCFVPHLCGHVPPISGAFVEYRTHRCHFLSWVTRYFSARGLDGQNRRLWPGDGQVPVEWLTAGGAAQWIHPVDGESPGRCSACGLNTASDGSALLHFALSSKRPRYCRLHSFCHCWYCNIFLSDQRLPKSSACRTATRTRFSRMCTVTEWCCLS